MNGSKSVFPTTPPEPTSRKTLWLAITAGVVVVVLAAVLVVVFNRHSTTTPSGEPTAAPSTPATTASPTSSAVGGSGFTGTTVDKLDKPVQLPANPAGQVLPQTGKTPTDENGVPDGLMWQKLYDLPIVPFSTSDGPTTVKDGVAQGWAHTPQGAALAALTILSDWQAAPDDVAATTERDLLSGDRSVIERRAAKARPARQAGLMEPQLAPATVAGVQVQSYTGDFARIDYGAGPFVDDSNPDGYYTVTTLSVTWSDGRWKLIVTDATPSRGERRAVIAGMTSWTD